jgi:dipeptidyl aminopeptidase/acylaminoacyl peptidase
MPKTTQYKNCNRPWRGLVDGRHAIKGEIAMNRPIRLRVMLQCSIAFLLVLLAGPEGLHAQFLPFGRNKIAYTSFDWRVLKTEHFDIYHYPEMSELAGIGAAIAEESFKRLEREFDFTITHRIPLIFYSSPIHFQQTNVTPGFIPDGVGGFFEFLKGRVVIPSSGSLQQFRHVITHELVHVFMHNKLQSTLRARGMRMDRYLPLWYVEGLAEYYSTEWDSQAEMILRDAVLNGYITPLSSIWMISGSWLMYKAGQAALDFLAREYGEENILRLIDNFWVHEDFSQVMKYTIGKTYEEFDREWMRDLRKRYFPLVETHDSPSWASTRVVREGFNSKPVYYGHGDSASVIYMANNDGYAGVYMRSLGAGTVQRLIQGEKTNQFEAFHLFGPRMDISNEGMLAFITKSGESDVLHLYDVAARTLQSTLVFDNLVMIGSPSWSPDGERIAFSAVDLSGAQDLYIVDIQSRTLDRLTNDFHDDRDAAWSPDGRSLVFSSDRSLDGSYGPYNLYVIDVESAAIRALTQDAFNSLSPSWSRCGRYIACTSDKDGTHNLYVISVEEADTMLPSLRQVSNFTTAAFDPVWTAGGGLLFSAFDRYSFTINTLEGVAGRVDSLHVAAPLRLPTAQGGWLAPVYDGVDEATAPRYTKSYQIDIAQSAISTDPVFGTMGGAALSLSDMLGDERYYFLIYNTAQTSSELLSSFNIAISRVSLGQKHPYSYGIFHYSGRRYDLLDPDLYFYERAFGGYFAAAWPISKFRRVEGAVSFSSSDKEAIAEIRQRKALLLTNSISYIKDNALYYWTGPIDGSRFNLTLSYTTDIRYSNVNYYSAMFDYRRYFRLGLRSAVATRFEFLYNHGKEARRYFLGGSWDLRGWDRWSIRGTKRWLTSVELRFPLLDRVGFDFPFGAINLGIMRGALFIDAGNSWDRQYGETLGSFGGGLRFNLFGFLVLRYDIGKRIERNFTELQSGLFHQFFFGWDF